MLDEFVASEPPLAVKRQAIGFRGSLYDEAGDLHAAKSDFLGALELSQDRDFERYTLEESVAAICQRLRDDVEAERWSLRALKTAAADPKTSGAGALQRLLRIRGDRALIETEQRLAERVVHQAWHLLRVEGEPDLADLEAACKKLMEAQKGPFSAERPPAPRAYSEPEANS